MTPPSPKHISTGFRGFEGGVNGAYNPLLVPRNQTAYAENATTRGGFIKNRPKFRKLRIFKNTALAADVMSSLFQGACYYKPDSGAESLVAAMSGNLYQFQFTSETDLYMTDQTGGVPQNASENLHWLWQSERWVIWADGINLPVFWDGSAMGTTIRRSTGDTTTPAELPICKFGCYGLGRNWVALPDGRSFIAGDIVNWSSGTAAFDFRDAVLKASANQLISGGGSFVVPGNVGDITAMRFVSNLDVSLGQGPLQVLTDDGVFSCNAPLDQSTWQFVTSPILTQSLINFGGSGQNSTVVTNGDLMFRSVDGVRSLILARREFTTWGNTPISQELTDTLSADDQTLLKHGSAIIFDNRLVETAHPVSVAHTYNQVVSTLVYHDKLIAMDLAPVSSLRGKQNPVWDGVWTGLNVLQLVSGKVFGKLRAFAFVWNTTTSEIEIYEILSDYSSGADTTTWHFITGALFTESEAQKTIFDLCRLTDGEIYVDSIAGQITFTTYYRPDYETAWQPWYSWTVDGSKPYATRMGLGQPSTLGNPITDLPYREGYTFQFKLDISGSCRVLGGKFTAVVIPQAQFAKPLP